jgi:ergothioneine biosynthesis protein EgtB
MNPIRQAVLDEPSDARAQQPDALLERYRSVRGFTESLCRGLAPEDCVVQSMPDVSPTKWHLAHTSWFFETFVLVPYARSYTPLNAAYAYLFNSYYVQAGERHCRAQRGYISRPTLDEVYAYRSHVDAAMADLLAAGITNAWERLRSVVELGLHHEQQHQELILTDIKHVFSVNPLRPAYREPIAASRRGDVPPLAWPGFGEGLTWIGWDGDGFAYDNEGPRHREFVHAFALASRLVTNAEYLAFMNDDGYRRPELWLSDGWAAVQQHGWTEPFYWEQRAGEWWTYTLGGMKRVDPAEPVCHVSYFEADAYARWAGARLPTEQEWEIAARTVPVAGGNFVETGVFHPRRITAQHGDGLAQMFGDVWEWTRSQYSPYPGYAPTPGALGEYNGKFMCNQFVLRGGSCATSVTHIRPTYRNFFPAEATWQFTGVRLAKDA